MSQSAKELEDAAKTNDTDFITENTITFIKDWRSYKDKLAVCIETEEKKQVEDVTDILNALQELKYAMDNLDIDIADEIMNQLRQYEYSPEVQEDMEQLSVHVVNLDSEQAQEVIDMLISKL